MITRIVNWFRVQRWHGEPHLQIAERLNALGKQVTSNADDDEIAHHVAACLNFLAVLCGTDDDTRLFDSGCILRRFSEEALEQFKTPEPEPEETLRRLTERGIDIACAAIRERKWEIATEGLAKIIYLDELSQKVASGEETLRKQPEVEWPDVVG